MNKIRLRNIWCDLKYIIFFIFFILFTIGLWIIIDFRIIDKGYSIFIEFNNAHGIKKGTDLRIRGIDIGSVKNIKMNYNSIL